MGMRTSGDQEWRKREKRREAPQGPHGLGGWLGKGGIVLRLVYVMGCIGARKEGEAGDRHILQEIGGSSLALHKPQPSHGSFLHSWECSAIIGHL